MQSDPRTDEFPKHYYDPFQGCLLRQDDADTLRYYYIEWEVLNHPKGPCKNAWELVVTSCQGYKIDKLLYGLMRIEREKFKKMIDPCQIKPMNFENPLPSWFSLPFRGSH